MPTVPPERLPDCLSAVLPAYNEAAVIATTLERTHAALAALPLRSFEVIIVDDGSRDATRSEAERVAQKLPAVRLISHQTNRGYGAALRSGFDAARGSAIFLMDSDGQFEPAELTRLLAHWDGASIICGYRAHRSDPLARRLYNRAFFAIVNARFGRTARDVNCAFKLVPRTVAQGLSSDGALISTELLLRARAAGCRIVDVAVSHAPRRAGSPTGANVGVVVTAFKELWRLDRRLRRERPQSKAAADATAP